MSRRLSRAMPRRVTILTVAVLGLAATAAGGAAAAASPSAPEAAKQAVAAAAVPNVAPPKFPLANKTGTCVAPRSAASNALVGKVACNLNSATQYWTLVPVSGTSNYRIQNNNGMCLVVRGTTSNTEAVMNPCASYADQQWSIFLPQPDNGPFHLKNANSGQCLILRTTESTARQNPCANAYDDQWWRQGMPKAPTPSDNLTKPVYLVHGYDQPGNGFYVNTGYTDAQNTYHRGYWETAIQRFKTPQWSGGGLSGPLGRTWTFCYYTIDKNCDLLVPGDRDRSIIDIGRDLAWEIYDHYSRYNVSVDVVAHSMGGLILRAALTGVQEHDPAWPPTLYIEDVTTLATPHRGSQWGAACVSTQCNEMQPGSDFLSWVQDDPQSDMHTDWTIVGSHDDIIAPVWSAVPNDMNDVGHKLIYEGDQLGKEYAHMDMVSWTGPLDARLCQVSEDPDPCTMSNPDTFFPLPGYRPPVDAAVLASNWAYEY